VSNSHSYPAGTTAWSRGATIAAGEEGREEPSGTRFSDTCPHLSLRLGMANTESKSLSFYIKAFISQSVSEVKIVG